jgi:hypothetical protein
MGKIKGKKGDILVGDVIFLVLNLIFLSILVIFIVTKTNDTSRMEEQYAKEIALMIDSAKPGMTIHLDMTDAMKKAEDEKQDAANIIRIDNSANIVNVKLEDKGGYSYSFFNDVNATSYPDISGGKMDYVFVINTKAKS